MSKSCFGAARTFAALGLICTAVGCVPHGRYQSAVDEAASAKKAAEQARYDEAGTLVQLQASQRNEREQAAKLEQYAEQVSQGARTVSELEKKMATLTNSHTEVGDRLSLAQRTLTELANERKVLTLTVADVRACVSALQSARTSPPAAASAVAAQGATDSAQFEACVRAALDTQRTVTIAP